MNDEARLHSPGLSETTPITPARSASSALLDFEVPIRMARGQAAALHYAVEEASADDSLYGAAEALTRQLDALYNQWADAVEKRRQDQPTASSAPPLPEDTGRTLGPGHLDMVHERISQAIGISHMIFAAVHNRENLPDNAEDAAWGQQRLLEEAVEHLNEYTRERAERASQERQQAQPRSKDVDAALSRLKRLDNMMAYPAPNSEDERLLEEAIELLQGDWQAEELDTDAA